MTQTMMTQAMMTQEKTKQEIKKVRWGDIYRCDLGNMKGSVQCGIRPVIVIQNDRLNQNSPTVTVAVITSVIKKQEMSSHILIGRECGLKEPSMILLEQTRTVDKEKELLEYIGAVKDSDKRLEIKRGIKAALGLPIKPKPERKALILTLCPKCRSEFMSVPENIVRRADYLQAEREICSKCQVGYGYDYIIMKKHRYGKGGHDYV